MSKVTVTIEAGQRVTVRPGYQPPVTFEGSKEFVISPEVPLDVRWELPAESEEE